MAHGDCEWPVCNDCPNRELVYVLEQINFFLFFEKIHT